MFKIRRFTTILSGALSVFLVICVLNSGWAQSDYRQALQPHQFQYKKDLASIIKEDTLYVSFFPVDLGYRVEATFLPLKNQPVFDMGTSSGKTNQAQKIGLVKFTLGESQVELSAYQ